MYQAAGTLIRTLLGRSLAVRIFHSVFGEKYIRPEASAGMISVIVPAVGSNIAVDFDKIGREND